MARRIRHRRMDGLFDDIGKKAKSAYAEYAPKAKAAAQAAAKRAKEAARVAAGRAGKALTRVSADSAAPEKELSNAKQHAADVRLHIKEGDCGAALNSLLLADTSYANAFSDSRHSGVGAKGLYEFNTTMEDVTEALEKKCLVKNTPVSGMRRHRR